jgi:RHS repeat-associated protein
LPAAATPAGLLYRRNRYYDPATGRFTQEDPIGLAGGINLYGFANGDPLSYSDPFGLKIECKTQEACDLYNDLVRRANEASRSSDRKTRRAGRHLVNLLNDAYNDQETTYTLDIRNFPDEYEIATGGGDEDNDGPGRFIIRVDNHKDTDYMKNSPWINLAHELGGAVARRHGKFNGHFRGSLAAENAARTLVGCSGRGLGRVRMHGSDWYSRCER